MSTFSAVLFMVGKPSKGIPTGARGRRIRLSEEAVEDALIDLPGKPICRSRSLTYHDNSNPIGKIRRAFIVGDMFCVEGEIFDEHTIDLCACNEPLGISYDSAQCHVSDMRQPFTWEVTQATFLGANVVLQREAAHREDCLFWLEVA